MSCQPTVRDDVPTVSIILPTFNRLDYLRPAVESVFAQTFRDWNLIVADDGSGEPTRAYLRTLESQPRVTVLWLMHSGNPGAVRNAALRKADGDYVAFLDSDDLWAPAKLERQISSLQAHRDLRWSYTGYSRIDERGATRFYAGTRQWIPYRGEIFQQLLTLEAEVSTPAVIVERALLERVGGFDEELLLFEDYDLWLRLARHSQIDLIDEPLIGLRSHQGHYSGGSLRTLVNRLKLLKKMQGIVTDAHLRAVVGRLRARGILSLARLQANSDRGAATRTLLNGSTQSWHYLDWWAGLPKVLLKLATPRALLALRRHALERRSAPRPSRPANGPRVTAK